MKILEYALLTFHINIYQYYTMKLIS